MNLFIMVIVSYLDGVGDHQENDIFSLNTQRYLCGATKDTIQL
jgi:hypothetical protein